MERAPSSDLDRAAETVVRRCLGVAPGEQVLVVCNPATAELGERLRLEAGRCGGDAVLMTMAERAGHGTEPPRCVGEAMVAADVAIAPTAQSLSHTAARKRATDAGVRVASLPGATAEMLARAMGADLGALKRRSVAVAEALSRGAEARLTCSRGSDLTLGLKGRAALVDDGDLRERGAFGNLPCGEGFIAPVEGTSHGRLVVDGSIPILGRLAEPVTLVVEAGRLVAASGPGGEELLRALREHGGGATGVAELGIGTNDRAILTGNVLEDEKIMGTAHVAFGASAAIGGTVQVPIHLDCVVLEPSVTVDGAALVEAGRLAV